MEENLDHEIFDLNPILPEIYTSHLFSASNSKVQPQSSCDHASRNSANTYSNHLINNHSSITTWNSFSAKQLITSKPASSATASASASAATSQLISFENSNTSVLSSLPTNSDTPNYGSINLEMSSSKDYSTLTAQIIKFSSSAEDDDSGRNQYQKREFTATRTLLQAQDHLMSERKRREKLGQLFISLSKVVPGLKKLDKASLLEDAINHLKTLKERASVLEEEEVIRNRSNIDHNYNTSGSTISESAAAPEIKARISNRNVLISICCDKQKGLISRIPYEIEKMHLTVMDMRAMPFGGAALYITILAEMHSEFRGTVKDIVDHLQRKTFFLNPRDDLH